MIFESFESHTHTPVVFGEVLKVVCVRVLVDILAGTVDVLGHVSAAAEGLVVHVVRFILTARKTAVHTLRGGRERVVHGRKC